MVKKKVHLRYSNWFVHKTKKKCENFFVVSKTIIHGNKRKNQNWGGPTF